jgi:hypothetical protein
MSIESERILAPIIIVNEELTLDLERPTGQRDIRLAFALDVRDMVGK